MPKSDTWPGGVAMETVISKDSTGSCDSVISMNSNFSDDSLDGFEPEVRDSLMFLDETIVSLELEEDSGVSNDELDPHTPTPHTSTLPDNKVTICLLEHTRQDDVSKYHEDPNQVMGKDHKPSMSYMVPTPLVLANGSTEPILLRSRTSFSAADHKPKPTPQPPTTDMGIPKHTNDTLGTAASQNSGDGEGATGDKVITVPAAVSASGPVAAASPAKVNTSEVPSDAPELNPAKLITDALEPFTDKPVGPSELISDKHAADRAEMDVGRVKTSDPVELMSTNLADSPGTDQMPTELQAPEVSKAVSKGSSDCSSTVSINEDATSATPVGDATTTPQAPAAGPVEVGMEFIPPPMDFMDEPAKDQDPETPVYSGINLADILAPHVPEKDVSEASFPASDIPAPDIPAQNVPDTTFPASDIPSPDIPVQEIPDTTFPASDIPGPDVPSQDVSDTAFPASDIPDPVVPSSDVPTQDAPVASFPVSNIPGPVISSPHDSPQVLSDAVIPSLEIPAQDNPAHDILTPVIPTPDFPAPVIPATDTASSEGDPKNAVVPPSEKYPKENEAASVPPAPQRGQLSYSELEKLRKKASMKKAPGTAPVVQVRGPAAPSQSSSTTEDLPGPPQEYCDPKSPPAVAPKPKKLPPNIIVKPHRSAESVAGPLLSANRVRTDIDKNKVHMEALLKLGLIKSGESDGASCSGPSLSPRSRRSWAPPPGPLASPGADSSGPPTPEPLAPLARRATGPKTHQFPAADKHCPKVSPSPNRKMVEVRLAPRQVPSDSVDAVSLRSDEDELEVPDHLPPSPPGTHTDTPTPQSFDNSSAPRSHGISVEISPLSSKEDRREALRKLGLLRD